MIMNGEQTRADLRCEREREETKDFWETRDDWKPRTRTY